MGQPNAAPAGSQPPSQSPPAAPTDWEAKAKQLEKDLESSHGQIRVLSKYRTGLESIQRQSGDLVDFNPETGEVKINDPAQNQQPPNGQPPGQPTGPAPGAAYAGGNPFAEVVSDPTQVEGWLTHNLNQRGYLTLQQAQEMVNQGIQQAHQNARADMIVLREVDKTVGTDKYRDLGSYGESDLAKRTQRILEEKGTGKALEGAKSWESWQYASPYALREAADLARVEMFEEQQAAAAAAQSGSEGQQAAALSVGQPGVVTPPTPQSDFEKLKQGDPNAMWGAVTEHVTTEAEKQAAARGESV